LANIVSFTLYIPALLLALMPIALWVVPTRVDVGADGLLVRWFGTQRFIRIDTIHQTAQFERVHGRYRYTGVRVMLHNGEVYEIDVRASNLNADETTALKARIDEAVARCRNEAAVAVAEHLARGDRSVDLWVRGLRNTGRGSHEGFRALAFDRDDLWRVLESSTSSPEARAAAAVVLTEGSDARDAQRIRVVADAVAEPRLRVALDASIHGDDAALATALDALAERQ
jgi:hypothetical protein